jgi:hypothetical protein
MMRRERFAIANIYVPIKRRATLKPETVQEIAQSILEVDGGKRYGSFGFKSRGGRTNNWMLVSQRMSGSGPKQTS